MIISTGSPENARLRRRLQQAGGLPDPAQSDMHHPDDEGEERTHPVLRLHLGRADADGGLCRRDPEQLRGPQEGTDQHVQNQLARDLQEDLRGAFLMASGCDIDLFEFVSFVETRVSFGNNSQCSFL